MIRYLYALNGIVAVLLYLPQIRNILRSKDGTGSFSLVTFGGWSMGSIITALYAWTFVKDPMFAAVSLANMTGSGTVFGLVAAKRLKEHGLVRRVAGSHRNRPLSPRMSPARHEADSATGLAENFG